MEALPCKTVRWVRFRPCRRLARPSGTMPARLSEEPAMNFTCSRKILNLGSIVSSIILILVRLSLIIPVSIRCCARSGSTRTELCAVGGARTLKSVSPAPSASASLAGHVLQHHTEQYDIVHQCRRPSYKKEDPTQSLARSERRETLPRAQ